MLRLSPARTQISARRFDSYSAGRRKVEHREQRRVEEDDHPGDARGAPPYEWWDWHDAYGEHQPSRWFGEPDPNDPDDQRPPRA